MERQSSTAVTPDIPPRPPRSTAASPPNGLAAADMQRACAIAQTVVAIAMGQRAPTLQAEPAPARAATFARQIAMYLAHVGFGISMAEIGRVFGRDRTTVVHACHLIEDRRDEVRFDHLLDQLEQAAIALRTASGVTKDGGGHDG
jgi:hypothetical protein